MWKLNKQIVVLTICACIGALSSCKKTLEILPEDRLDKSKVYNTVADADAAVFGIYGQVAGLGKQYILWNELRADLMDITINADPYLQQISDHDVTTDNPYTDPTAFYKVIFNCNDVLKNFQIMADESKMSQEEFAERYSDIAVLRTWLYLQLGIHFGQIPYIKDAIENVDELQFLGEQPKLSFDQLIEALITDTKDLPYLEYYAYPEESSMVFTTDGRATRKIFISKPHVLGELYLWKGNYYQAAYWYKKVLSAEDANPEIRFLYNTNRVGWFDSSDANIQVSFGKSQEGASLVNSVSAGWRSLFALANTNRHWFTEWNWSIPYSNSFAPGNPFVELATKGGKYQIRPSQKVMDLWDAQTLTNGVPWDARGKMSYELTLDEEPVITKLTDNSEEPLSLLNKGGQWNIYRAAGAHLRFSEAANRDGHGRVAYALLNNGIKTTFYYGAFNSQGGMAPANFFELESQITHEGFGENRRTYPTSSPYYFDARDNASLVRGVWYRNIGVRSRAMMPYLLFDGISFSTGTAGGYGLVMSAFEVGIEELEDKIIEESALELAFEGERWSDLTRIARRRNDPAFLADKVYEKLLKANNPKAGQVRTKLMDMKNWYLPFDI
ncbi:RagB/SusD family nutrient uptake outer membrane protein [Sphingobacterium pedocola]|uniref:RagB/SusD family protein n=1 Tax=Sphingobacterium pedocola TaxID=2082722 RepID=A0ABR9T983_9SPHI|nr:RagB/SusD family nutrient uptake outer membrane protein [Sphingobacterium pedocola]MBE8721873.1 RagB/SusD family protein [Sphingobacterium pedocola]